MSCKVQQTILCIFFGGCGQDQELQGQGELQPGKRIDREGVSSARPAAASAARHWGQQEIYCNNHLSRQHIK